MPVIAGRSRVATTYGIVAASQPLAARAGVQILERGGNAVDAAIAANAVLGVTEPQSNGIGGDLFAMVYDAKTGTLHGLNASGWAPRALTPQLLASRGITSMPQNGVHAVTVPGAVAGWEALRTRLGRLPLAVLLAPAIRYADEGFPLTDVIAAHWAALTDKLAAEPSGAATYLPDGRAPRAGELFRNRDLAATLTAIATDGPAAFYDGPIASAIVAASRARGGTLDRDDLREFDAEWVEPISTTYRGWIVYELPPNTQGIAALLMLNLMEQFPLGEYGFHSTRALHVMIEAKKLAYADMLRYVGDPRFATTDVAALLSKRAARERATQIDAARAATDVRPSVLAGVTTSVGADTVYLCAIDRDGNIASLIQSIYEGFGTAIVPAGTGFALHSRGGLFTLEPNHANTLAPRKRPLHTIIPAFMQKDDVRIGFGIMGAFNQAQAHAQFVASIVDYGMDIQQALEAGRFTKGTFAGADVNVEALVPEETRAGLAALGHEITTIPPRTGVFGHGQAVMSDGYGVHFGASEPRHDGAAIPEAPSLDRA
ncbi:MAG TPA: gamma-glutamyltransferase [Vicinamibacterales bacterium]|nr:gamma-glutamyltransferase [Vicinamibacterales bacterium]